VRIAVSTGAAFEDVLDRLRKVMGYTSLSELVALTHEPIAHTESRRRCANAWRRSTYQSSL
jgi:hypothetical protein